MIFVDTNYFLRYFLNDDNEQHTVAKKVFIAGSEGKADLITSLIVFFEVFWVLYSVYKVNKNDIIIHLQKLLQLTFIKLSERELLLKSLELYKDTNLDLEDCYNVYFAKSQGVQKNNFLTFDKQLHRIFNK